MSGQNVILCLCPAVFWQPVLAASAASPPHPWCQPWIPLQEAPQPQPQTTSGEQLNLIHEKINVFYLVILSRVTGWHYSLPLEQAALALNHHLLALFRLCGKQRQHNRLADKTNSGSRSRFTSVQFMNYFFFIQSPNLESDNEWKNSWGLPPEAPGVRGPDIPPQEDLGRGP